MKIEILKPEAGYRKQETCTVISHYTTCQQRSATENPLDAQSSDTCRAGAPCEVTFVGYLLTSDFGFIDGDPNLTHMPEKNLQIKKKSNMLSSLK